MLSSQSYCVLRYASCWVVPSFQKAYANQTMNITIQQVSNVLHIAWSRASMRNENEDGLYDALFGEKH